jgi:hypothetical protein
MASIPRPALLAAMLLLCSACASRAPASSPTDGFEIRVENPTDDMIQLFFENDAGARRRIGTVLPRSTATLHAPLVRYGPGWFIARRLGQTQLGGGVGPRLNPLQLGGGAVTITLHPLHDLDRWTIRR